MITKEYVCLYPFVVVHLKCDNCGKWSKGSADDGHVVEVNVIESGVKATICKHCFQEMAREQDISGKVLIDRVQYP